MKPKKKYKNSPFFTCIFFSQSFFILSGVVIFWVLGVNGYSGILMSVCLGITLPVIIQKKLGKWMPNAGLVLFVASVSWFLGICFLLWGWLPSLEQLGPLYGVDPARYYYRSIELLDSGFDMSLVNGGLTDPGILYFYAVVMAAFGKNIFSPYFANYIIYLIFIVFLIKYLKWYPIDNKSLWIFSGVMLLPELVWFSVLPGKDFLVAVLSGIVFIWFVEVFVQPLSVKKIKVSSYLKVTALVSVLIIALVRPTYLFILIVSLMAIFLLQLKKRNLIKIIPSIFLIILVIEYLIPVVSQQMNAALGSYDLIDRATNTISTEHTSKALDKHAEGFSDNSIARRLIPTTFWEFVYLSPLRFTMYILGPLNVVWTGIRVGGLSYSIVQQVSQIISAIVILLGASLFIIKRFRYKTTWRLLKPFLIFSIVSLFIISNIIMILHPRYRVFALLPFFVYFLGFCAVKHRAKRLPLVNKYD